MKCLSSTIAASSLLVAATLFSSEQPSAPEEKNQEDIYLTCPAEMSSIEDKFCIDKWEASIVDQATGKEASPYYIPSQEASYDAEWQYDFFKDKSIPADKLQELEKEHQPFFMPARGAEQFPSFQPLAVSLSGKIPATYVTKTVAEQACAHAGKRLCTRKEWYQVCVGPNGPSPYRNQKGEEEFPEFYPYGATYEKGKCNMGLQAGRWPPGLLGRKNNQEMLDPRISALLGKDGLPMKRENDAFPQCTNQYEVYNMVGNIHEIVADVYEAKVFPKERMVMVGSHYARTATQSCAEDTKGHWKHYTDYSIGFRCCKDIQY